MKNKGFTLIEMLVVLAIIGVLAATIMASLNNAKNKAKDAAIINGMKEMQKLAALEYEASGNYTPVQPNNQWIGSPGGCDTLFTSGTYLTQVREVCKNILKNSPPRGDGYLFYAGNWIDNSQKYSFLAALHTGTNQALCVGSSGTVQTTLHVWSPAGCYGNP